MTLDRAALLFLAGWTVLSVRSAGASGDREPPPSPSTAAATAGPDETASLRRALQVLVVTAPGWDAPQGTAQRFERSTRSAPFRRVGAALPVWLGRRGLGWRSDAEAAPRPSGTAMLAGPRKQEGDGRSPAGILTLGPMRGYAVAPPAGSKIPYRQADERDRCVDDAESPYYNQLTRQPANQAAPWKSAESLRLPTDHYKHLVVLNYNTASPRRGAGSCIFLHVAPPPGAPTAGCTALREADLLTLLRWLDPARSPVLLQLPAPVLAAAAAAWAIPGELLPGAN